ncbi:MAG: hypothetical protein RBT03_06000 [Kiritimatiellia bacterium]|jgi:hypothetical protein|nr:hypothetical protein [Kiritimatiellia bacterium]
MLTLLAVGLVVGFSIFASWWLTAPGWGIAPSVADGYQQEADSAPPPPPRAPASPVPAVTEGIPLAWRSALESPATLAGAAAATNSKTGAWEQRAFELEKDNVRLRGRLDDMINWMVDNVRGTFPLPEEQMAHLRLKPVGEDMGVSDDLIRLLRLDEQETDRLDAAFVGTRTVLWDLEGESIQVESPAANHVVLNIPPYAEEGEQVREALYDELEQTLGTARFSRFLQVAELGLDESFDYFGESDRLLQFEAVSDEVSGSPQLYVRDERVVPNREDPLRLDIIASERIVAELPEEYLPYWNWLPEIVTRFSRRH